MSVQRNYIPGSDAGMKNAHLLVFQQQMMMGWRSYKRIQRLRPWPEFRVRTNRVLAHAVLRKLKCRILLRKM